MARHRIGDLLGEARDLVDLHARRELELVAGDGGADGRAEEAGVDAELAHRRLEDLAALLHELRVDLARLAALQDVGAAGSFHGLCRCPGGRWIASCSPRRRPRRLSSSATIFVVVFLVVLFLRLRLPRLRTPRLRRTRPLLLLPRTPLRPLLLRTPRTRLPRRAPRRRSSSASSAGSSERAGRCRPAMQRSPTVRREFGVVVAPASSSAHAGVTADEARADRRPRGRSGAARCPRRAARRSTPSATSTITAPAGPSPARSGPPTRAPTRPPACSSRSSDPCGFAVAEVHQADGGEADEREPMPRRQPRPGSFVVLVVFVVVARRGAHRGDQRERADHEREREEEPAAAEHRGGAVVDGPAERPGEVGVDPERRDDADDPEQDRERVGAVGAELVVDVVAPGGSDRDSRTPRGPPPRPTL